MGQTEIKSNRDRPLGVKETHANSLAISTSTSRSLPSREKGKGEPMVIEIRVGLRGWEARADFTGGEWIPAAWTAEAAEAEVRKGLLEVNPGYRVEMVG